MLGGRGMWPIKALEHGRPHIQHHHLIIEFALEVLSEELNTSYPALLYIAHSTERYQVVKPREAFNLRSCVVLRRRILIKM